MNNSLLIIAVSSLFFFYFVPLTYYGQLNFFLEFKCQMVVSYFTIELLIMRQDEISYYAKLVISVIFRFFYYTLSMSKGITWAQ